MNDLNEAIVLDREELPLCPPRHPGRSLSLYNIALRLSSRYEQLGGWMTWMRPSFLAARNLHAPRRGGVHFQWYYEMINVG